MTDRELFWRFLNQAKVEHTTFTASEGAQGYDITIRNPYISIEVVFNDNGKLRSIEAYE